jgi:hypothetical protein
MKPASTRRPAVMLPAVMLPPVMLWALTLPMAAAAQGFEAEGSDTGAGLGPRWVAVGGAGSAAVDDVHAIYLNPAGLADVGGLELSASRQLNARLHAFNFIGAA